MQPPWWPTLTVWVVVNVVSLCQAWGFWSRRRHGMRVNRILGVVIAFMAVPASAALVGFAAAGSPWWIGPAVFDAFVVLMIRVDYWRPIEFRHPARRSILVPYLVLFFGAILLMGLPMFRVDHLLWGVTVITTILLLVSMLGERASWRTSAAGPQQGR